MTIVAFLPCRAGSQRVPHKNTRRFGDHEDGLVGIKLEQLVACESIDEIVLSTNDEAVLAIGHQWIDPQAAVGAINPLVPFWRSGTSGLIAPTAACGSITGPNIYARPRRAPTR